MKITKTLRVLFLVVAISVLLSVAAFAAPMRASKYLSVYSARLTKTSNGDLSLYFHVTAPATMDHLGASRIAIQRYTGSYWRTEYNFTYPGTPELQTPGRRRSCVFNNNYLYTAVSDQQLPRGRYVLCSKRGGI